MGAIIYRNYYLSYKVYEWKFAYTCLANLACFLHIVENFALVTLTNISSDENHGEVGKALNIIILLLQYNLSLSENFCYIHYIG